MDNSFDLGAVFQSGISYLSHSEQDIARKFYKDKLERNSQIPDIILQPGDTVALDFVRKSRDTITEWVKQKKSAKPEYINIGSSMGGLSGFQRRLIYQLVRTEYPGYRTFARNKGQFMQIEKLDPGREAQVEKAKFIAFEGDVAKQIGLGFIFNALSGGDLSAIDPKWFLTDNEGNPAFVDLSATSRLLDKTRKSLKVKRPLIVGHNLFTDLVFIYKTFVGPLPSHVSDFKRDLQSLFPRVIDTKYMATEQAGPMYSGSSLREVFEQLKQQIRPSLCLADGHYNYSTKGKDHEAGYDSWMTAQVFAKLSTKLEAQQQKDLLIDTHSNVDRDYAAASEEPWDTSDDESPLNPPDTDSSTPDSVLIFRGRNTVEKERANQFRSRFSTKNVFAQLNDEADDDDDSSSSTISSPEKRDSFKPGGALLESPEQSPRDAPRTPKTAISLLDGDVDDAFRPSARKAALREPRSDDDTAVSSDLDRLFGASNLPSDWHTAQLNPRNGYAGEKDGLRLKQWIPDLNSKFWDLYSNKLRVYGTETEICNLDE